MSIARAFNFGLLSSTAELQDTSETLYIFSTFFK